MNRRQMLEFAGRGMLLGALAGTASSERMVHALSADASKKTQSDEELLDEMERASFDFFWNETNPETGQIKDRAVAKGGGRERMSSIAATGFGLSALCIGD